MAEERLAGEIGDAGHVLRQRVYFEDTDFSGVVYHARYLHFMERGRSDFLRLLGIHHAELAKDGLAFAVRHMDIDFLRAGRIDDILEIVTRPASIGGARLVLDQAILRDGETLVRARVTAVLISAGSRPMRMPAALRARLAAAPAGPGPG